MPTARPDDTLEMYYEEHDFTDPWLDAETVVLHHGNAKSSRLWYAWVPLLARRYRVVQPDARGFGRSTVPPPGYAWSLSGFATDLKNLLDALELEKVHLIGETVGGTISLQFAYEHPEKLKSLAICTSPYKFAGVSAYGENRDLVEKEGVEEWARRTIHQRLVPGEADPGHVEWYVQQMGKTAKHVVTETLGYLAGQDLSDMLPEVRVPTLILAAEDRHAHAQGWAEGMSRLIPNSKLVVIPGTSGYVQHSFPERCAAAWLEFAAALK